MESFSSNAPLDDTFIQQESTIKPYANFWIRLAAYIIDAIIIQIGTFPLSLIFGFSMFSFTPDPSDPMAMFRSSSYWLMIVLSIVITWVYYAWMESSEHQGTLGKKAVGIKVVNYEGGRVSFAQATGRHFAKIISGIILLIGYIMAAFTERKQALHDIMAQTLVTQR